MKCKECEKTIDDASAVVVERTKGKPSTIARYPSMRICNDCYLGGEYTLYVEADAEVEIEPKKEESVPKFDVVHICSQCSYEYNVVTQEVDGKMVIATSVCPQCKRIDKLYLTIKRV